MAADGGLVDHALCRGGLCGVNDLGVAAVVEGDREHHAGVRLGVGDGLADGALHVLRGAGVGAVERAPHPLDANVELVELGDAPEELLVQAKDVAHLGAGTHPVLGGEAEHGEPADVAGDRNANQAGQVLFALGVTLGAREVLALGPPAVAVHDARHVHQAWAGGGGAAHGTAP